MYELYPEQRARADHLKVRTNDLQERRHVFDPSESWHGFFKSLRPSNVYLRQHFVRREAAQVSAAPTWTNVLNGFEGGIVGRS
jgi:hypothetical protein